MGEFAQHIGASLLFRHALARFLDFVLGRRDHHRSFGPIEDGDLAAVQRGQRLAEPHDGGKPQRAREDGHVCRGGTGLGGDRGDALAIELHRERRREVVCDEDRVAAARHVDRIVIRQIEQDREHANVHVGEIPDLFAQHGGARAREVRAPFQQHDVERLLRAKVLTNERGGGVGQFVVVENRELHIEDGSLLGARVQFGAGPQVTQSFTRALERRGEAVDLANDGRIVDDTMPDLGHLPPQKVHRSHDDPRRRGNAAEDRLHSALSEARGDERREGVERVLGVGAVRTEGDGGAVLGGQHHDAHDALAVHLEVVARDGDVALEPRRGLDHFGRRTRMQSMLVHDLNGSFSHQRTTE